MRQLRKEQMERDADESEKGSGVLFYSHYPVLRASLKFDESRLKPERLL